MSMWQLFDESDAGETTMLCTGCKPAALCGDVVGTAAIVRRHVLQRQGCRIMLRETAERMVLSIHCGCGGGSRC